MHFRERNKVHYRLSHWPIWIFVFFLAPGPLYFRFIRPRLATGVWCYGWAWSCWARESPGLPGRLPGVEPRPYILRFTEDKPNPLYRRVCYTVAWGDLLSFAILNLAGLSYAVVTGAWRLRQIYESAYFPLAIAIWILGAIGKLPRVGSSTRGEGTERRYFYGTVWAVCAAEPVLGILWKTLPRSHESDVIKLVVYVGILLAMGLLARRGALPRTRAIKPGEWAISD